MKTQPHRCALGRRALPLLFLAALGAAGGNSTKLGEIYARFEHVKSVSAGFTETITSKAFKTPQVQKGVFYSSRDGSLLWDVREPVKSTFTVKGSTAKVTCPDLDYEKTYDLNADAGLGEVVRNIFAVVGASGPQALKKGYEIGVEGSWKKGWKLTLVPKSEAVKKIIPKIILTVTAKDFITAIEIVEANGDAASIAFTGIVFNPPPP